MAYVVGSASVEIVPDFRNAQLAITAFFNKQQNELRIPVKPDISPAAQRDAEQQAAATGKRVGKAMADAAEKEAEKQRERDRRAQERLGAQMAQDVARSLVARSKAQETAAARELAAQERLGEQMARLTEKAIADRLKAQERLGAAMARDIEREIGLRQTADQRALAAQVRLGEQMAREIEREATVRERANERSVQQTIRAIEREAAESAKIRERAHREAVREQEREAKETLAAIQRVFTDAEEARIKIELDREQAIMEGRTAGGLVARAIKQEIHQNAGLITAALTGVLVAGGPASLVAAQGLFVGIAAVGAFQSQALREDWVEMFDDIRVAGVNDTAVLVPAFQRMSAGIGNSFERMRPQIREGLADAPILIDMFTESLTQAGENAVPGLVRSITNGRPVMQGFGDLMEAAGQGVTDFLDEINEHAPAAGQSLSSLGDATGELLPLLGELLGEGAELGTIVLPVLTTALGGARSIVESLGGSLPVLATGFLAFRTIQGSARFVNQFAQGLENVAPKLGVFAEGMTGSANVGTRVMTSTGKAASAVAGFGRALPGVGVAVGVVAAIMADGKQRIDGYAQAMLAGGAAAKKARDDIADPSAWDTVTTGITNLFDADMWKGASTAELQLKNTRERVQELEASMSPLELAQSRLAGWTETLAYRMDDESASAGDVAIAQRKVAEYTARTASEQEKLEKATRGVTQAMADQANQARSQVDAEFGYQQALLDVQDAQVKLAEAQNGLNEARASGDPAKIAAAELELKQALLDTNTALSDQVRLAGEAAMSRLPASMDDTQKSILGAKAELDELNRLLATGVPLPPEMEAYRQKLLNITGEADGAKLAQAQLVAALGDVGFAVSAIPNSKSVQITAPTEELRQRLQDLGFSVEDIPGTKDVRVTAITDEAEGNLGNLSTLLTDVDTMRPEPVVDANTGPLEAALAEATAGVENLDGQRPKPVADANIDPLAKGIGLAAGILGNLDRSRANPTASVNDQATGVIGIIQGALGGLRDRQITVTMTQRTIIETIRRDGQQATGRGLVAADGGAMEDLLSAQRLAFGGAPRRRADGSIFGRGGPRDDLVPLWGSPGEHMLDAHDVALMGGQAGVYAFREALNSGAFNTPSSSTGIREMVTVSGGQSAGAAAVARSSTPTRSVALYTPDVPAALRELKALEHREEVLASPWP